MAEIIDLKAILRKVLGQKIDADYEAFLVSEGLDLLATFREIEDPAVRGLIIALVRKIVKAPADSP